MYSLPNDLNYVDGVDNDYFDEFNIGEPDYLDLCYDVQLNQIPPQPQSGFRTAWSLLPRPPSRHSDTHIHNSARARPAVMEEPERAEDDGDGALDAILEEKEMEAQVYDFDVLAAAEEEEDHRATTIADASLVSLHPGFIDVVIDIDIGHGSGSGSDNMDMEATVLALATEQQELADIYESNLNAAEEEEEEDDEERGGRGAAFAAPRLRSREEAARLRRRPPSDEELDAQIALYEEQEDEHDRYLYAMADNSLFNLPLPNDEVEHTQHNHNRNNNNRDGIRDHIPPAIARLDFDVEQQELEAELMEAELQRERERERERARAATQQYHEHMVQRQLLMLRDHHSNRDWNHPTNPMPRGIRRFRPPRPHNTPAVTAAMIDATMYGLRNQNRNSTRVVDAVPTDFLLMGDAVVPSPSFGTVFPDMTFGIDDFANLFPRPYGITPIPIAVLDNINSNSNRNRNRNGVAVANVNVNGGGNASTNKLVDCFGKKISAEDQHWNARVLDGLEYVDKVSDSVKCGICLSTVYAPIVTQCRHMFCYGCINQFMMHASSSGQRRRHHTKKECPVCRKKMTKKNLTKGSYAMVNFLGEFMVKCPNFRCCEHSCQRQAILKHFKKCFGHQCTDKTHDAGKCRLKPRSKVSTLKPKQMKKSADKNRKGRRSRKTAIATDSTTNSMSNTTIDMNPRFRARFSRDDVEHEEQAPAQNNRNGNDDDNGTNNNDNIGAGVASADISADNVIDLTTNENP